MSSIRKGATLLLLTVDTNILRDCEDADRPGHHVAIELLDLHRAGKCEIRTTTRLHVDVPKEPLRSRLNALNPRPPLGTVFSFDHSRFDSGDVLADDQLIADAERLMELLFPLSSPCSPKHQNRLADIDHLLGHRLNNRELFVTSEKAILLQAARLAEQFGTRVVSPEDTLSRVLDAA